MEIDESIDPDISLEIIECSKEELYLYGISTANEPISLKKQ